MLDDETISVHVADTPKSWTFYRVKVDGIATKLGSTRRRTELIWVARDLKRVVATERDQKADAWIMNVVR